MKNFKNLIIGAAIALPTFGFAAEQFDNINKLVGDAGSLVNLLIVFVIGLATLVFIWGLLTYIASKEPDKQKEAKQYMIWGIIGLFVMVSVWGLVGFLQDALFGAGGIDAGPSGFPQITP